MSPYLFERLSKSFAVNRTYRPFSNIALDQAIECSINNHGKNHEDVTGRFTEETIDVWINSYTYRAVLTGILHDICDIETDNNNIDSHIECTPTRQTVDEQDLTKIINKPRQENIFSPTNIQFRKLMS
ncbi:unnamed protein product, partial [Rotaria sordida]